MRVVVIGAGVVGLAIAEALTRQRHDVWVLERLDRIGAETSSRNSEVIHAGLYYATGSLKHQLCIQGREMLVAFCQREGVRWQLTGKLLVATADDELPALEALSVHAKANGTRPLTPLSAQEIHARWPQLRAVAGLFSTGTGIVDSHGLMTRLRHLAERRGAHVLVRHTLRAATRRQDWQLVIAQPDGSEFQLGADVVVNAAGLWADDVAQLPGPDATLPRHTFVKGNYFTVTGPAPADTLVYPLPSPSIIGLGTHLTLDLGGQARLGPDVQPAVDRQDYAVDPQRAAAFLTAARRFWPGLTADRLQPAYAGIRPKLATDHAADFLIRAGTPQHRPGWIDLLGIESPGLTASLAIAAHVVALVS